MSDWWTDERIQELKKLWAEGHSCTKIGKKMENTRSAIIGKVHRLGLPGRTRSAQPVKRPKKLAFPKPQRAQKDVVTSPVMPLGLTEEGNQQEVIKSDAFKPPVGSVRILVSDLTSSTCRWPLGDPGADDFTFCGANTCTNKDVYCQEHRRAASKPGNHIRDKNSRQLQVT